MAQFVNSQLGCGCADFVGMYAFHQSKDEQIKTWVYQSLKPWKGNLPYNLVLFGDGIALKNGTRFAEFVEANKLGKIVASEVVKNKMHSNDTSSKGYQVWLWYVDEEALKALYAEEAKKELPASPTPYPYKVCEEPPGYYRARYGHNIAEIK